MIHTQKRFEGRGIYAKLERAYCTGQGRDLSRDIWFRPSLSISRPLSVSLATLREWHCTTSVMLQISFVAI